MNLIEQIEADKSFGVDIMKAASIRPVGDMSMNGLQVSVTTWFSKGNQVGPVFAYLGNEANITIIWPYRIKEPRIYQSTLKKALPIIKKSNHTGQVTLRTLISGDDKKAYGIRWHTGESKELVRHTSTLLKISFCEWAKRLENGVEGDSLCDEFHYKYAGNIIDGINQANTSLLTYRVFGYELPFNQDSMGESDHGLDRLHQ